MTEPVDLVEVVGRLPGASNTTVLALDGGGEPWVYKPTAGEQPLWDFPWRTLAAREVLAYRVSEAMGLGVVPETRPATGPLGDGSAQRFLDEDHTFDPRPLVHPEPSPALWPVAVLDVVTNQADRKLGHLLRERGTGRLFAIDNGLTFHPADKLRTVLWGLAGRRLPRAMVAALRRLAKALDEGLADEVGRMLGSAEADALGARTRRLLEDRVHPHPPHDRPPVPWPPW